MPDAAIVLTDDCFTTPDCKVAHGLVRGSERFDVVAVLDASCAGRDAGELLDGRPRGIPVFASLGEATGGARRPPRVAIVGVATHGGRLTGSLRAQVLEAVEHGLSVINGLHGFVADDPALAAAAERRGVTLTDVRRPPPAAELHFWQGEVCSVRAPRIAVLGTDCALGKRTTTRLLVQALRDAGLAAEMIYTGQTGWMQGASHGIVLDALPNDFVCGELERALVACDRERSPDVMLIEGQSALRNPAGPCGAEFLLAGQARGVVLQHAVGRECFEDFEHLGIRIPDPADEIDLIARYGARTLAVTLNGRDCQPAALSFPETEIGMSSAQAFTCTNHGTESLTVTGVTLGPGTSPRAEQAQLRECLGIPVVCPLEDGVGELVPVIGRHLETERAERGR